MSYESVLNKKEVRCRFCNKLINFVEAEEEYMNCKSEPTMWGFLLLCPICNLDGEVKHSYVVLKGGGIMNFQDFLSMETSIFNKECSEETLEKEFEDKLANRK